MHVQLEQIQTNLTLCEKALAEYLDTKRLSFPRFYFVSSADLLDILSNGSQPSLVGRIIVPFVLYFLRYCISTWKYTCR